MDNITPPQQPSVIEFSDTDLNPEGKKHHKSGKKSKKPRKPLTKKQKIILIITASILFLLMVGSAILLYVLSQKQIEREEAAKSAEPIYSLLTGENIDNEDLNKSPTYCVQTPNGMDGARPQVGLNQAGVVFEAIAEAGITRFAAVYQNPTSSAIGPIRSLRIYYLEWDTPFDCTIVHAGGSAEAIAAAADGTHRDLTESTEYMWRDYSGYRAPNNLFTSPTLLKQFNDSKGYTTSNLTAFPRLTPVAALDIADTNYANAHPDESTSGNAESTEPTEAIPLTETIHVNFGTQPNFNTVYTYDYDNNRYLRAYANGGAHMVYTCPSDLTGEVKPQQDCGEPSQVAPKAIAVMRVNQTTASDNYHQNIDTIGSGEAYVFQNGQVIKGTWKKTSAKEQIKFTDESGNDIAFTPGQLWIAAIPQFGSVEY